MTLCSRHLVLLSFTLPLYGCPSQKPDTSGHDTSSDSSDLDTAEDSDSNDTSPNPDTSDTESPVDTADTATHLDTSDTGGDPTCGDLGITYDITTTEVVLYGDASAADPGEGAGFAVIAANALDISGDGWDDVVAYANDQGSDYGMWSFKVFSTDGLYKGDEEDQYYTGFSTRGLYPAVGIDLDADGYGDVGTLEYDGTEPHFIPCASFAYGPVPLREWSWDVEICGDLYSDYGDFVPLPVGDPNGDGTDDVRLGDYVVNGPILSDLTLPADAVSFVTLDGYSLNGGSDLNGDGVEDVIAEAAWTLGSDSYVFYGPLPPMIDAASADVVLACSDFQTWTATPLNDWDLDGLGEIVLRDASSEAENQKVLILPGTTDDSAPPTAYATFYQEEHPPVRSIEQVDDINRDGRIEVAFQGFDFTGKCNAGVTYLIPEPGEGTQDLQDAASAVLGPSVLPELGEVSTFGDAIVGSIDFDRDGTIDLIASDADDSTNFPHSGALYFIPGDSL